MSPKVDMTFGQLPANWNQAPHFGNAMGGSMLYAEGGKIRLQLAQGPVERRADRACRYGDQNRVLELKQGECVSICFDKAMEG